MSNSVTTPAVAGLAGDNLDEVVRNRRLALAREALRMKVHGETVREIGHALGVSHETARKLIRWAREASESK